MSLLKQPGLRRNDEQVMSSSSQFLVEGSDYRSTSRDRQQQKVLVNESMFVTKLPKIPEAVQKPRASVGSKLLLESSKMSAPVLKNIGQRGSSKKRNLQSYLEDYNNASRDR